jgi:hypothetical protein
MSKKLFILISVMFLRITVCMARPDGSQVATNWGESVEGVQMSIELNTNVVAVGSAAILQCQIENSSTNPIYALISSRVITATLVLTNNFGKAYNLTLSPKFQMQPPVTGHFYDVVNAKEIYTWSIPFKIDEAVEAGDYELGAQRFFRLTPELNEAYKLVSNSLKVTVIKQ